jgi:hypothetical protein
MGLRGVLAESVYVNLGNEGDKPDENSPPLPLWTKTIHPLRRWANRLLRNDLMYVTTTGMLYCKQRLQFLGKRELSMVEKRKNDPDDVADIFVGEEVESKIPCLSETWLHVSTLPEFQVHERDRFQELYPEYWSGLHLDVQEYISNYDFNCDVYVNPDTCELVENDQGHVKGLYTMSSALHMLTKAYWSMGLSSEERGLFAQKDFPQFLMGFTGSRDGEDRPDRTGCFIIKIPSRGNNQRIKIVFMSFFALRLMLMSYYVWMTDGSLERQAYRYGLEMPAEAYGSREWDRLNQDSLVDQAPAAEDDGASSGEQAGDNAASEEQTDDGSHQAQVGDDVEEGLDDVETEVAGMEEKPDEVVPPKKPRF